jgi:ligand-binding SRPBCC domain-containing protein
MPSFTKEVIINAPLESVYTFVSKPYNLPQIWPSLIEITNEKLLSNGGYSFHWKYKMAGMHFKGTGECIDIVPNLWFTSKTQCPIDSTHTWTFRSRENKTRVILTVDYRMPAQILNRLTEITLTDKNEKEAELI